MKFYVVIAGLLLALFVLTYFIGVRDGKNMCNMRTSENVVQQQIHLIKLQDGINEESMHVTTGDIRRVLREKYTIAE